MESYSEGEEPPSLVLNTASLLLLLASVSSSSFSPQTLLLIPIVVVLIIGSALVSASEVAFFSLDRQKTDDLEKERTAPALRITRLLHAPHHLLATILIVNNLFNISIILALHLLTHQLTQNISPLIQFFIQLGLITSVLVLFGEILPKVYAQHYNIKVARFMSLPLLLLQTAFYPLVRLLVSSTSFFENRFAQKMGKIAAQDIDQAIGLLNETHDNEKEVLKRVIDFSKIAASEIMTDRTQVAYIKKSESFADLHQLILETGFSRIPVCEEDLDDVKGFVYAKDLLKFETENPNANWHILIREPFFVSENTKLNLLLETFKNKRKHIAVVVDEYGGGCGVVSLEDVLEQVVGEIEDEFDDESPIQEATAVDDKNIIVEGIISIIDLCRLLKINHHYFNHLRGDNDTLAGMLLEIKGAFLEPGEDVIIGDYKCTILATEDNRITEVKVDFTDEKKEENQGKNAKKTIKKQATNKSDLRTSA